MPDVSFRVAWTVCLIAISSSGVAFSQGDRAAASNAPVAVSSRFYPKNPSSSDTRGKLEQAVAYVMSLSEEGMLALVPDRAGLRHVGCPHCPAGQSERDPFTWDPRRPDRIECRPCVGGFPDPRFPAEEVTVVRSPRGRLLEYRYWRAPAGQRFYLPAQIAWQKRVYMSERCFELALLYHLERDRRYARRAALILNRFAETFPDYVYHFDYPNRNPRFFDGEVPPADFLPGYRSARWSDWAYKDIPVQLVLAFELIRDSGELERIPGSRDRIVNDFFVPAAEQVAANPEVYTNMSPFAWEGMTVAGLVLQRSEYLQGIAQRLDVFTRKQFFYDGMWKEGTFSYHRQALVGIDWIRNLIRGRPVAGDAGGPIRELLARVEERVRRSHQAFEDVRMPSGRSPAIHDTWAKTGGRPLGRSRSRLLGGLGHALLAHGEGARQVQAHLSWSAGYQHHHYDALSLIFFANGAEQLSDIGYTHTRLRGWTMATASHNTVVVDLENQIDGGRTPSPGNLLRMDTRDPRVQLVTAASPLVYRNGVSRYERTLALVDAGAEVSYLVDVFHVAGGRRHDYFLHGSADVAQSCRMEGAPACEPVGRQAEVTRRRLAPGTPTPPRSESDRFAVQERGYAYQFLEERARRRVDTDSVWSASFDAPEARAVIQLVLQAGDKVVTGVNPQVRPAQEREAALASHSRPFLMVRRAPGEAGSRFISILHAGEASGPRVSRLPSTGEGVALLVRGDRYSDLIAIDARALRAEFEGVQLRAEGDFSIVRLSRSGGFLFTTGQATYGGLSARAPEPTTSELVRAEARGGGGRFVFAKDDRTPFPEPGATLLLSHGDGTTHGYTIERALPKAETLEIWTLEPPGFALREPGSPVRFEHFPGTSHPGPTRALWQPSALSEGSP